MKKLLIGVLLLVSSTAFAQEVFKFTGLKAYDGDTIKTPIVAIKGLPTLSIRVFGIDTPEIKGKCEEEKVLAKKARDRLNVILKDEITVQPMQWDKYGGRFVATIYDKNGKNIAETLISEGLGRPYFGEQKTPWCK
jgi:micrococcal nuclease